MVDTYKTIKTHSEGLYKEKGSKFIAKAYPVKNEEEIKGILQVLRKEYYDARHHCYAYRLGADKKKFRANDDGEPSSSAGKPILGQLQSYDLTNLLIVVVRYFGGTKLGVSGLINAYRSAAAEAIEENEIIELKVQDIFEIKFDYFVMNDVMKILKDEELEQFDQVFELSCSLKLKIRQKDVDSIKEKLEKVEGLQCEYLETI